MEGCETRNSSKSDSQCRSQSTERALAKTKAGTRYLMSQRQNIRYTRCTENSSYYKNRQYNHHSTLRESVVLHHKCVNEVS
jgi:hypothetical protein